MEWSDRVAGLGKERAAALDAIDLNRERERVMQEQEAYKNALVGYYNPQQEMVPGATVPNALSSPQTPPNQYGASVGPQLQMDPQFQGPLTPTPPPSQGMLLGAGDMPVAQAQQLPPTMRTKPFAPPQNYAQLRALKDAELGIGKPLMEVIPSVFASGNNKMKDEIAARLVSTGLPVLTTIGEVLQKTKLIDPQNRSTIFDLTDPREIARYKALFGIEPPSNFVGSVNVMWNTNEDGQPIPRDHKPLKENLSTSKPIYKDFVDEATGKNHTWLMNDDGTKGKDLGPSKVSIAGSGRYQASPEDIKLIAAGVRAIPPRVTIDKLTRDTRAQVIAEVEKQNQMEGKPGYTNYMADIADVKAGTSALQFSTKMTDMTRSFISTMDSNISMLEKHIEEFSKRHNMDRAKILNMGTRAFNMKVMGDADFSIYDMLISSISTENAKLQLGGAGSVAQVAEGARIKMDEIHNKDMPVSEMLKLLNATRTEGNNRATALQKEVDKRRNKLRVGDTDAINPPAGTVADGKTGSIKKEDMATIEFKTKAKAALQADNFPNKAEFDFNGITMVAVKTKTGYDFYPKKDGPPR